MRERKLGILGKKIGMTRIFNDEGHAVGVTVVELGPCTILGKRSTETRENGKTDGYTALQLGFDSKTASKVNKPDTGSLKAAGGVEKAKRFVRELRVSQETAAKFEVGQELNLSDLDFKVGDKVDVAGRTQGKGFQGVVRRYDFAGLPATHGAAENFRHPGSIGCRKWPGRVFKGKKMPGHMGDKNVTTQNIQVVEVRPDDNVILLRGSVPGAKNGYVLVRPAIKRNPLP